MSNGTNVSLLATTTTIKTEQFPWYTAVVTAFILPPIVLFGLIGNILTLIILFKDTECVPEKARLNMIILAAFDSIELMFYAGRLVFFGRSIHSYRRKFLFHDGDKIFPLLQRGSRTRGVRWDRCGIHLDRILFGALHFDQVADAVKNTFPDETEFGSAIPRCRAGFSVCRRFYGTGGRNSANSPQAYRIIVSSSGNWSSNVYFASCGIFHKQNESGYSDDN